MRRQGDTLSSDKLADPLLVSATLQIVPSGIKGEHVALAKLAQGTAAILQRRHRFLEVYAQAVGLGAVRRLRVSPIVKKYEGYPILTKPSVGERIDSNVVQRRVETEPWQSTQPMHRPYGVTCAPFGAIE